MRVSLLTSQPLASATGYTGLALDLFRPTPNETILKPIPLTDESRPKRCVAILSPASIEAEFWRSP